MVHQRFTASAFGGLIGRSSRAAGFRGEFIAALYLRVCGYKIIEQNYCIRGGELDIVARKKDCLVFVEVKRADSDAFGDPLSWVTRRKQNRVLRASLVYIHQHELYDRPVRFDVIVIRHGKIEHVKDAFRADI